MVTAIVAILTKPAVKEIVATKPPSSAVVTATAAKTTSAALMANVLTLYVRVAI